MDLDTLNTYLAASKSDLAYCEREIAKHKEEILAGNWIEYHQKEIRSTEIIMDSHKARIEKYENQIAELTAPKALVAEISREEQIEKMIAANLELADLIPQIADDCHAENVVLQAELDALKAAKDQDNAEILEQEYKMIEAKIEANIKAAEEVTDLRERMKVRAIVARENDQLRKEKYKISDRIDALKRKELSKTFTGVKYKKCRRCAGTGLTGFTHVQNGVCFQCNGAGQERTAAYEKHLGIKKDGLPY